MTDSNDLDSILNELRERTAAHEELRETGSVAEVAASRDRIEELRSQLADRRAAAKPPKQTPSERATPTVSASHGPSLGIWPTVAAFTLAVGIGAFFLFRPTSPTIIEISDSLENCEWKIGGTVGNRTNETLLLTEAEFDYLDPTTNTWITVELLGQPVELEAKASTSDDLIAVRAIEYLTEPCPQQITKIVHRKARFEYLHEGRTHVREHAF